MNEKEILEGLLSEFFRYNKYPIAINLLKDVLIKNETYRNNWSKIVSLITERLLKPSEPLNLIQISANLVLDENTDNEAYKWLDLLLKNVERNDGIIEEY